MAGVELALAFVIIGILMLLAEAASPGSFIIVPASVLIVLGGMGMLYPDLLFSWWAPFAAVVILVPMTLVTIKLYQNLAPPAPPETTVATSLVGLTGVVMSEVSPNNLRGKVRIAHDSWSATSASKTVPVGAKVRVVASEGVHVRVEELVEEAPKVA
jgi:membrane protein implicated in regulation of membrane protease activity